MRRILLELVTLMVVPLTMAQTVVINEIAWMGTHANYNDEWIELYNLTGDTIDLNNWKLRAVDGAPQILLQGRIPPYGYFLLERGDDQTISDYPANQIYTGSLGNEGEHLILENDNGQVMDQVNCSSGWFAGKNSPIKYSMEKKHPWAPSSSTNSWADNNGIKKNGLDAKGQPINGTPAAQNSVYQATKVESRHEPVVRTYRMNIFPNPFCDCTTIRIDANFEFSGSVELNIYDLLGKKVSTLHPSTHSSMNYYEFTWNGCDLTGLLVPPGIYFICASIQGKPLTAHRLIKTKAR